MAEIVTAPRWFRIYEAFEVEPSSSTLSVILGTTTPTDKLPLTLPGSDAVIAVKEDDICASTNDMLSYNTEKLMNGQKYYYLDQNVNDYQYGFGLSYNR